MQLSVQAKENGSKTTESFLILVELDRVEVSESIWIRTDEERNSVRECRRIRGAVRARVRLSQLGITPQQNNADHLFSFIDLKL